MINLMYNELLTCKPDLNSDQSHYYPSFIWEGVKEGMLEEKCKTEPARQPDQNAGLA